MADDMRIPESEHISADDSIFNLLPNITISQEDDDFADALYKKAETGFPVRLTAKKLTPGRALAIMERHGFNATRTGRALRTPLSVLTNYIYTRTWLTEIVANNVQFLGSPKGAAVAAPAAEQAAELAEEVPF